MRGKTSNIALFAIGAALVWLGAVQAGAALAVAGAHQAMNMLAALVVIGPGFVFIGMASAALWPLQKVAPTPSDDAVVIPFRPRQRQ